MVNEESLKVFKYFLLEKVLGIGAFLWAFSLVFVTLHFMRLSKRLWKVANLNKNREKRAGGSSEVLPGSDTVLNFGGQNSELWCKGGEIRFLRKMLKESKKFAQQCQWFTSLVSKSENVKPVLKILTKLEAVEVKEIEMKQGNKVTRIVAWRF